VAFERAEVPMREFTFDQTREKDIALFVSLASIEDVKTRADVPTYVLVPAFVISELKRRSRSGSSYSRRS
jgi:flagellar biosynthetic protein FliP